MYTVRDEAGKDFEGTLRRVKEMGYRGVELAGTNGLVAGELKGLLFDVGLECAGNHVSLDRLENEMTEVLDYNSALANDYIICPYIPEDRRRTADDWRQLAESLNDIGIACQEKDITFCYHNHAFEFERIGGQYALDFLFDATFSDLVRSELDVYWVAYGGEDPVEYLRRYGERVPLVHLKDMAADETRTFAEIGEGKLDIRAIVTTCQQIGVDWLIVEQDTCNRPSLESAAISFEN